MLNDDNTLVLQRAQVGALVWRFEKSVLEVLLVNSRDTGRLVIPKGWTEKRLSDVDAAANEAYEEAGVRGIISREPIGFFSYNKNIGQGYTIPLIITVYAIRADLLLPSWPEMSERRRYWMTLDQAAASVDEPDLKTLIEEFVPVL